MAADQSPSKRDVGGRSATIEPSAPPDSTELTEQSTDGVGFFPQAQTGQRVADLHEPRSTGVEADSDVASHDWRL